MPEVVARYSITHRGGSEKYKSGPGLAWPAFIVAPCSLEVPDAIALRSGRLSLGLPSRIGYTGSDYTSNSLPAFVDEIDRIFRQVNLRGGAGKLQGARSAL